MTIQRRSRTEMRVGPPVLAPAESDLDRVLREAEEERVEARRVRAEADDLYAAFPLVGRGIVGDKRRRGAAITE